MALLHQGGDRRILKANKLHLLRLRQRDTRALDPKPTTTLSTRQPVFDPTNTALITAVQVVQDMVDGLLLKTQ
jgi:hypothetical protein